MRNQNTGFITLIFLFLFLNSLSSCGPKDAEDYVRPVSFPNQKSSIENPAPSPAIDACKELPPLPHEAKEIFVEDVYSTGHLFKLVHAQLLTESNFLKENKTIRAIVQVDLSKHSDLVAPDIKKSTVCKSFVGSPDASLTGHLRVPLSIYPDTGELKGNATLSFKLYGKNFESQDSLSLGYDSKSYSALNTLNTLAHAARNDGEFLVYRLSPTQIEIRSRQTSSNGAQAYRVEIRYIYELL